MVVTEFIILNLKMRGFENEGQGVITRRICSQKTTPDPCITLEDVRLILRIISKIT